MNNQQQIIAVLTKIKESQQKIKVKTSKYLKQLDIFKMQLNSQEIRLYLVGNDQLPYGLLYCIGNKSKVDGSLRKSAYYSAELFLNILEKHPQRIEFIKAFSDLEDEEYKLLSLSTHVLADKKLQDKGLIAFKIIKFLKDERPHFNLECILEIKKLKEQFDNWYKSVRIQQIQEHNKQTSWKESEQPPPENLNLQREQNKRQKKLEHITLQWDGNPEYLIKTFYNPFVPQQRTTKSNKNRSAALKKKQIAESLNAVIDVESVEQIKQQNKNLDKLIVKIHLDSPQFDAQTFLRIVQPQITKQSMTMLQQQNIEMNKNIVYYFIDDFFCINQGILQIHNQFISKEFADQIKRKKSLASNDKSGQPMQVDQILILGSLSKRTFQLLSKLNSISQSMNKLKMSQEHLKSAIDFIRKCEQYVQLPNQLKEAYLQRNNARVMKLISLQKENINQYKNESLFKQLNEQINQVMKQIYNDMLQQIKQDNLEYNQILEIAEYINELNLTQNSTQDIVNNLQQSIKTSFNAYFNKTLQQRDNEAYQVEMIRGDFIIEFLQQCSLPQKELQLQNCKALESFVSGKFSKQVKQFQNLCRDLNLNPNLQKLKEDIENKLLQFLDQAKKSWFSQQYSAILCQRINQDIESIKNMAQIIANLFGETPKIDNCINDIEVQSLSLQFSNYTLKQIKANFVVPQRDFFGVNFSEYMLQIFNEIFKQGFIYCDRISKNKNVDGQLFLQLMQDSLNYIQSSCKEAQDYLIFLHNLKLISSQIKELAQSVYSNSKKQKTFKEFAEPIQQQINGILSKYYQPCLQSYVKLLNLDQPQGMDMIPRPYVIQWLTVLNEQAVVLAQINLDQSVTDSIMSFIVSQCFKNIEAVSTHAKRAKFLDQLNHEINLIKIMTLTFQGSVSQEGFQRLQRKLEELSQNTLSDTSEWARTQKFKIIIWLLLTIMMNFNGFHTERIFTGRGELTKPDTHHYADDESPENSQVEGFDIMWKKNSLKIFCTATKFMVKLKTAVDHYRLRQITHRIYQIIGDKASDYFYYQAKGLVNQKWTFQSYIKSLLIYNFWVEMQIGVIKPDSKIKLLVDCTILILIVMNIFYIPMQLSFSLQNNAQTVDFLFSTIPSWVFLMEIIINFNTAYYYKGMIHEDRTKIFQHYIKGDFFKDLLVVIPFLISQYNIPYLNFVLLLRITRVNKIFEQIEEVTMIREKFAAPIDVLKLMIFLIFVAHVSGCAWHYIGIQEFFENNTGWLIKYGYSEKDWVNRYVVSLYFGTVTSFTVGFGDIVPQTLVEQVFLIIMVLITSLVFGYTISSIQNIFGQLREKTDQHRNKMAKINSYMKKNRINPVLQMKIRKYFEYFFTLDESPELLMDNLNEDLKLEFRTSIYKPIITKCKLFKKFDDTLLNQLCSVVQIQKFIPGQMIFQENDSINKAYFLIQGEVDVQINKVSIQQQSEGSLGIREFLLQKPIHFSLKATQFTEIAYILYEDFKAIIREKQSHQEQYCQMKDQLLYQTEQLKCEICSQLHHFRKCPVVFYSPPTDVVVCDNSEAITQPRYSHKRKQRMPSSTLVSAQYNLSAAVNYMYDNELLNEGINDTTLKKFGYVDVEEKQQTIEDVKLKSLKVIQKLQEHHASTPKMKRMIYKNLLKKDENKQILNKEESILENMHQEFINFKKEDLNNFDLHMEFSHYHQDKNLSKVLLNFSKQSSRLKPKEQFFSKTRLGKTKQLSSHNTTSNNLMTNNHSIMKTIFNKK